MLQTNTLGNIKLTKINVKSYVRILKEVLTDYFVDAGIKTLKKDVLIKPCKKSYERTKIVRTATKRTYYTYNDPKPLIIVDASIKQRGHVTYSGRIIGPDRMTQAFWSNRTSPLLKKYCSV
jgi:hypothetical protein